MAIENIYERTKKLMSNQQWKKVIKVLPYEVLKKSDDWRLFWNAGWSYFKLNQFEKATSYFRDAHGLAHEVDDMALCLAFLGVAELENGDCYNAQIHLKASLHLKESAMASQALKMALVHLSTDANVGQIAD
ncbi:hypothetical protein LVD15_23165 [Fulvivirga maritima]|uniref:hypothetical protein n=1 Tax=Fulvivirga maritima TaxID=2904247 RepID=UPI001F45F4D3|nr:hypothetical protein [Fulvivirga maritima]UII26170.1 hypothetical protein LVD15_23165 [Fulvivirga maritima]